MPRVLVVDDQKVPRIAVSRMLEDAGYNVSTADGGETGLALARSILPDIIILDVNMPGMDGFAVVEQLKADPETAPTPVIFLTAEAPTDDLIVRGLDLGAYDFISKGCSRAELLARVGVMVRIKRGNDELSAIARISDSLIQTLDPAEVTRRFVEQVRGVFRSEAVMFSYFRDDEVNPDYAAVGFEPDDPLLEALARTLHDVIDQGDGSPAEITTEELGGPAGVLARRLGAGGILAARVERSNGSPALVAVISRRREPFARQNDAPLLHLLARQASTALDNALLHEQTRSQAIEMEDQAEKLERAISQRSRFFASMSHELRTPINAVIGYNQLLEIGTYGEMTSEQTKALGRVSRSAQHLLDLINDILDISKIEAGKLEVTIESSDLSHLIADTITSIQIQAEEKGLAIEVEAPGRTPIETDAARVRQILLNLLSNAVKFTAAGRVVVEIDADDESYQVAVRDTGPGVAAEDRDRIFEEFEQVGRETGGTGLGLPISKRLAHLLGGELHLETEIGRGSSFILTLPRHYSGATQRPEP